jgi:hypothetical protein
LGSPVVPGFTFYGTLPPGQEELHLAIVLRADEINVIYCYCTSRNNARVHRYLRPFVIEADLMGRYFKIPKTSYVFLSDQDIKSMPLVTLSQGLEMGIYASRGMLEEAVLMDLVQEIYQSGNISARFKGEILGIR